ncbi:MAG: tetratricopeptide repeat protein, partial [Chloroflexi bacterium]|nr:tetratricopeptide repeat protein [Chloroflexota bacterium]
MINLKDYLRELDHLLDQQEYEEVIGHCRHILQHFPKNIDTYRVLGRALIEKSRFDEAEQVFLRLLSAVPGDFVAHVGLSDVYQYQQRLDRAIWHLERAFEQRPNDSKLTDNLRLLYEQYTGDRPTKIQLTRAALARQYSASQMYEQAISELRQALKNAPQRLDLRILLMQTLWDANHFVEAGETALAILHDAPDSLEANQFMAQLWLANKRPDEARPFLEHVEELAPYLSLELIYHTFDPAAPVPEGTLRLPRLEWTAEAATTMVDASTPDWFDEIGDAFDGASLQPAVPDTSRADASVPDWVGGMDQAGTQDEPSMWSTTPGLGFETSPSASTAEQPESVEDWFAGITGELQQAEPTSAGPSTDDLPNWFGGTDTFSADTEHEQPVTEMELPDWADFAAPDERSGSDMDAIESPALEDWLASFSGDEPASDQAGQPDKSSAPELPPDEGFDWVFEPEQSLDTGPEPEQQAVEDEPDFFLEQPAAPGAEEPLSSSGFTGLLEEIGGFDPGRPREERASEAEAEDPPLSEIADEFERPPEDDLADIMNATRAPSPDEVAALLAAARGDDTGALTDQSHEAPPEGEGLQSPETADDAGEDDVLPDWLAEAESHQPSPLDEDQEFAMLFEDDLLGDSDEPSSETFDAGTEDWLSAASQDEAPPSAMYSDEPDSPEEVLLPEGHDVESAVAYEAPDWLAEPREIVDEEVSASPEYEQHDAPLELPGTDALSWLAEPAEAAPDEDQAETEFSSFLAEEPSTAGEMPDFGDMFAAQDEPEAEEGLPDWLGGV